MVMKSNDRLAHITSNQIIIIVILCSHIVNVNNNIEWLRVCSVY